MKRFVCVMLFLVMLVTSYSAFASVSTDGVVKYKGLALIDFHLRASPDNDGRRLQEVPKGIKLSILEWDDSWCLATYKGFTGYAKTEWLYRIQSMDAMKYPFPAFDHKMTGYVTFNDEMLLQAGEFKGVTTQAGQLACVEANADKSEFYLPIWRDAMLLSDGVTLSAGNEWTTSWPGLDPRGAYTVQEINCPKEYTPTYTREGNTFIVTNKLIPKSQATAVTGSDFPWYLYAVLAVVLLGGGGFGLWYVLKRRRSA